MTDALSLATTDQSGIAEQLDYQNQFVSFWINGQLMGIPVNMVQEVLNPQTIAATPLARREIAGLLNLRGQIVTALNLRRRLGLPDFERMGESMNVVIRYRNESYSLLVDEVGDVINVQRDSIEPPPRTIDSRWKNFSQGVFRLEGRLLLILNVAALLTLDP